MYDDLKIVNLKLGEKPQLQNKSISINLNGILNYSNLTTVKKQETPIKIPELIEKPIEKETPQVNIPIFSNGDITIDTGYTEILPEQCLQPSIKQEHLKQDEYRDDSLMDTVDSGFGEEKVLRKECKCDPHYRQHLCKDNYLSEFKEETEKVLARTNLGVYSKEEIDNILDTIVGDNLNKYITKSEVVAMIEDLDFVDSILKSEANYEIPDNLFTL